MIHQHHRIAGAVALAVALAAIVAPVASADPQPLASAEAAIAANGRATTCSGTCVQAVGQAPAAELGINPRSGGQTRPSEVVSGGRYANPTVPTTRPRAAPPGGFDWGDAGIGAGFALALLTLLAGGALVTTKARQRPPRNATQPTA
jgi:hypothetical protein